MRDLHVMVGGTTGNSHRAFLRNQLKRAHPLARSALRELSVAIVGDATMTRLHRRFMRIDGPTDVLSFEIETDRKGQVIAGEIVLCLPEAIRQARRRRIHPRRELLLYAIHGLLHLSGYDDKTEKDFRQIHRMEDRILRSLGVGTTFAQPIKPPDSPTRRRKP